MSGGSVSSTLLEDLQTKLTNTKTKLESGDAGLIGTLTREDILGDMFHVGTLGYFGQYIALAQVASKSQQAGHQLPYGYGTFGHEPNVQRFFGIPRAITTGGVVVNVRLGWVIQSLDGDPAERLNLSLQTGILSSVLEHAVPEQMFTVPGQPAPQGVSAIKALQIASSQGQRIYHITPRNQAQALPNLHLDGLAMQEITTALATGKEVITHTDRISVPGWTGEGYILFDPVTGNGAYKISGGTNGNYIIVAMLFIILTFFFSALAATGSIAMIIFAGAASLIAMISYTGVVKKISDLLDAKKLTEEAVNAVKLLSILSILTSGVAIAKSLKLIDLLDLLAYASIFFFYSVLVKLWADPYSSPF